MSELRVGFAGAGFIAGVHAAALSALPGVRIIAAHEPDAARAGAFASETGARAVPSFEALLETADAVYVCAPNSLHAGLAIAALDAGKHVFSEKPPAISVADARRVHDAAARARGVYQIGFNRRFAPAYLSVRERIEAGELRPRWAHLKMNRGELQQPPWVADAAISGGFLYESTIHLLDLVCWLFGPAREMVCRAAQSCAAQLDDFAMLLTFESGLVASLTSSAHTTWLFPFERVEVYGEHAVAVTEEVDRATIQLGLEAEPASREYTRLSWAERWGYVAENAAFLAAVRGEAPPAAGASDALRAVELVDACYRAAETGEAVRLGD